MTKPAAAPPPDLSVTIAGLRLRNPVMVASGTFGYGAEYADVVRLADLGAIVVKGISLAPCAGNATPRLVEVPGGLVNAIGLQNPGVEGFIAQYLPFLRRHDVPVIVNIWGRRIEEYAELAARLDGVPGVHALEINISCPNIKDGGHVFGTRLDAAAAVVAAVRAHTRLPIMPKLAPNVTDIAAFALAVEAAGADAIALINSYPAMVIDVETRRPVLANVTGGLSGPAIHPIAVKLVYEAARAVKIPVIGIGGIAGPREALEFLIAGASAVQIGSGNFGDPAIAVRVADGIADYLRRHAMASMNDLIGSLSTP